MDHPIKGLTVMLQADPEICDACQDASVGVSHLEGLRARFDFDNHFSAVKKSLNLCW